MAPPEVATTGGTRADESLQWVVFSGEPSGDEFGDQFLDRHPAPGGLSGEPPRELLGFTVNVRPTRVSPADDTARLLPGCVAPPPPEHNWTGFVRERPGRMAESTAFGQMYGSSKTLGGSPEDGSVTRSEWRR
jgi:hypothetical protein